MTSSAAGKKRSLGVSMSIDRAQIDTALSGLIDPNTSRSFTETKSIRSVTVDGANVSVNVVLGYPAKSQFDAIRALVSDVLARVPGVAGVRVDVSSHVVAHAVQRGVKLLPNVKNIIAVASGSTRISTARRCP
jgi:ATP-binding protein involved in chromosome partitioning